MLLIKFFKGETLSKKSATVFIIFIVAVIAFCFANIFAAMTPHYEFNTDNSTLDFGNNTTDNITDDSSDISLDTSSSSSYQEDDYSQPVVETTYDDTSSSDDSSGSSSGSGSGSNDGGSNVGSSANSTEPTRTYNINNLLN